jgi:integrase/recombinase XerC
MSIDHAMTVARLAADLGVSLEEIGDAMRRLDDPVRNRTVTEHVEVVLAETSPGTAGTYRRYWNLLVEAHGDRPVAELTVEHLRGVTRDAEATKTVRANSNGTSLAENCVAALRRFMRLAVEAGIRSDNPALLIAKPKRGEERRRALTNSELDDIVTVTATTGRDIELDMLLVRFHLETGARRGGAIALRRRDIDVRNPATARVRLREKNNRVDWQPISGTLAQQVLDLGASRGATDADDQVFRLKPCRGETVGSALTRRRYNTIVDRWRQHLGWVANENMSFHWLRHHAITSIERIAGFAVAEAFARHQTASVTGTYIKARQMEVRAAFNTYIGEQTPEPTVPVLPRRLIAV